MLPDDCAIWRAALLTAKLPPGKIFYDIQVGDGRDCGHITHQKYAKAINQLTVRRIDAIIKGPNSITIVEITKSAGLTAIGQLITYPILYQIRFNHLHPIKKLLVTTEIQPDIRIVLETLKIPVLEIPPTVLPNHTGNAQETAQRKNTYTLDPSRGFTR